MYVNNQADNYHAYFKTLHLLLYSINIHSEEKAQSKYYLKEQRDCQSKNDIKIFEFNSYASLTK